MSLTLCTLFSHGPLMPFRILPYCVEGDINFVTCISRSFGRKYVGQKGGRREKREEKKEGSLTSHFLVLFVL